jgi:hypothetical protein
MSAPQHSLSDVLGAPPPDSVRDLPAASQDRLTELITLARAAQAQRLSESLEAALRRLPLPLRGPVRRILLR